MVLIYGKFSILNTQFSINSRNFALAIEMIAVVFIRLVVKLVFKVKIMLLDYQTTLLLAIVAVATILSVITLVNTNMR